MHTLHSVHPSPQLRAHVVAYAQRNVAVSDPVCVEPITARLEHVLEFEFAHPLEVSCPNESYRLGPTIAVVGPQTLQSAHVRLKGPIDSFAIFFKPSGLRCLFNVPVRELIDKDYEGTSVLGRSIQHLWEMLAQTSSFQHRVQITEKFLSFYADRPFPCNPVWKAVDYLTAMRGNVGIKDLGQISGLGVRQFERRFLGELGMTPKCFAKLIRFQTALDSKLAAPEKSWLEIAHLLDYHDQMHLIRDFRRYAGGSPTRVMEQLGDMRPAALMGALTKFASMSHLY